MMRIARLLVGGNVDGDVEPVQDETVERDSLLSKKPREKRYIPTM